MPAGLVCSLSSRVLWACPTVSSGRHASGPQYHAIW